MPGALTTTTPQSIRGWARIAEDPNYPPTVHLDAGGRIALSTLADGEASGDIDEERTGWFEFDISQIGDPSLWLVFIGETGEVLGGATDRVIAPPSQGRQAPRTYRDGLAVGLTETDVLGALYLDILKRPADPSGLSHLQQEMRKGTATFESVRKNMLGSDEYMDRSKRPADAAGLLFRRGLVTRTSRRILDFEFLLAPFLASEFPLDAKLRRFFPAFRLRPLALEAVLSEAAAGLPQRESFFLALSHFGDRPSLLIDPGVLSRTTRRADATDAARPDARTYEVSCRSRLFLSGWQKIESCEDGPCRWMEQVAVILDPTAGRLVQRIEIMLHGGYADFGNLIAATEDFNLVARFDETGRVLALTSDAGPFRFRYLVLIAERATCPARHDGRLDFRLISINVTKAVFTCPEESA